MARAGAQVRRSGIYRAATFPTRREAKDWATAVESQAHHIAASGFAPVPKGATLADLIDKYIETFAKTPGKTKAATLEMLKRDLGKVKLSSLSSIVLRDFIDRRSDAGADGVTIAADLSFLSAVLKWGRHARQLDIPERLALDARGSLQHRGLSTRSRERTREPTDDELTRLNDLWRGNARQIIDPPNASGAKSRSDIHLVDSNCPRLTLSRPGAGLRFGAARRQRQDCSVGVVPT